jgi:hypothetical protein
MTNTEETLKLENRLLQSEKRMLLEYYKESSQKQIRAEDLFTNLEMAKDNIAKQFANKYFNADASYYWIGEILSICDEFIDLENIKYAIENNIYENVLFKYLSKPRNYNLADYCLGKVGRKQKREDSLKKSANRCAEAWQRLREEFSKEYCEQTVKEDRTLFNKYGKEEEKD